ncbi:MAG: putative lipid II flippase FtsW [Actinomycetota bacterium]|nr:putative lipid II flippase FtsW [Actinomycetota bacterium]
MARWRQRSQDGRTRPPIPDPLLTPDPLTLESLAGAERGDQRLGGQLAPARPSTDPAAGWGVGPGWLARGSRAALLCIVVGLLCLLGLMMVLSASSVEALHSYGGAWLFFQRQVLWLALGGIALVVASRVDYHLWRRLARPGLLLCLVLLVLVLVPGVGLTAGGSTRWLGWGPLVIQPSELAKLVVLVFAADLLARRADRVGERGAIVPPLLLITGAMGALIMAQPDMGTTMILTLIALTVVFVGGLPILRTAALVLGTACAGLIMGLLEGYRRDRLFSFLDPWADAGNTGYQVAQSLVALGSGGVTGVGLGASRAKWGFLPNAHTDFIFAIIGEELGLLGTLVVVGLFVAFTALGIGVAFRAPDRFGSLVAAGVTAWVAGQALINLGAVTGRLPVTGVPLPFVSFGGSALVVTMLGVGVLVNVARTKP